MPEDVPIFSPEYEKGTATQREDPSEKETPSIEMRLEEEVKEAVKAYGTGKPRRETIRAYIIHG